MVLDVLALLVAVVALAVSAFAVVYSRRSTVAAERSADASVRSADAAVRSADAAERSAPPAGVAWSLEHYEGDLYVLRNVGGADAYRVHVGSDHGLGVRWEEVVEHLPSGGAREFFAGATFETDSRLLTVGWWDDRDGTSPHEWQGVLPARR